MKKTLDGGGKVCLFMCLATLVDAMYQDSIHPKRGLRCRTNGSLLDPMPLLQSLTVTQAPRMRVFPLPSERGLNIPGAGRRTSRPLKRQWLACVLFTFRIAHLFIESKSPRRSLGSSKHAGKQKYKHRYTADPSAHHS